MNDKMRLFFSGVKNPAAVSDLRTALALGYTVCVERTPTELLPNLLFLAVIGRHSYKEEIVDDYPLLFAQVKLEFTDSPSPGFWHPQLFLVSTLAYEGPEASYRLDANQDTGYMFAVYEELRDERQVDYLRGKSASGAKKLQGKLPPRGQKKK